MTKILVSGDVQGDFETLFKRIAQLATKGQVFDVVFALGDSLSLTHECLSALKNYPSSSPPLYIIDSGEMRHSIAAKHPEGGQIFPNVHFLGRMGVRNIHGLTVGYVSGLSSEKNSLHGNYSTDEIESFCRFNEVLTDPEFRGTDLFLSCQWPGGISFLSSSAGQNEGKNPSWSISHMAYLCKPRYLLSTGEDLFYKREPFLNGEPDKGHATGKHICRFIGLAKLSNKEKGQQSFFGFQVDPIASLAELSSIAIVPPETTHNPLDPSVIKASRQAGKRMSSDPDRISIEEINGLSQNISLFFAGFPLGTTHQEIEEFIGEWGGFSELLLLSKQPDQGSDRRRHQKPTYGFVTFLHIESTKQALRDSGMKSLRGKPVYFKRRHANQAQTRTQMYNDPGQAGFGSQLPPPPNEPPRRYGNARSGPGMDDNPCWFCFDNPKIDKSLIFYEGKHFYLALDKGPILPFHMLLVPKRHFGAKAYLSPEALDECRQLENRVAEFFLKENKTLVSFERNLKLPRLLSHMHMNMIGLDPEMTSRSLENLEETVRKLGVQFFNLKEEEDVNTFIDGSEERQFYLSLRFYSKRKLICILSSEMAAKMPKDFLRSLVCQAIGLQQKADWRTVQIDEATLPKTIDYLRSCFK